MDKQDIKNVSSLLVSTVIKCTYHYRLFNYTARFRSRMVDEL